jgi:uncharacterized Tic20 family protein
MSSDAKSDGIQPSPDDPPPVARDHAIDEDDDLDDLRIDHPRGSTSMAVWCHWGGYLTWIVLPLIFYMQEKDKRSLLAWHAREALNFQIMILIYFVIVAILPMPLMCLVMIDPLFVLLATFLSIGSVTLMAIYELVVVILAGIAASRGQRYRYPLTFSFIPMPTDEANPFDDRE